MEAKVLLIIIALFIIGEFGYFQYTQNQIKKEFGGLGSTDSNFAEIDRNLDVSIFNIFLFGVIMILRLVGEVIKERRLKIKQNG